jgi:hypothetical protein
VTTCSGKVEKGYEFYKKNCEKEIPGVPRTHKYCVWRIYGDTREFGYFYLFEGNPSLSIFTLSSEKHEKKERTSPNEVGISRTFSVVSPGFSTSRRRPPLTEGVSSLSHHPMSPYTSLDYQQGPTGAGIYHYHFRRTVPHHGDGKLQVVE